MMNLRMAVVALATCVEAAKILLLPAATHSHIQQVYVIGAEMMKSKHHQVSILVPEFLKDTPFLSKPNIREMAVIKYEAHQFNSQRTKGWQESSKMKQFSLIKEITGSICKELLEDEELLTKLKNENFDFAVVDGVYHNRCLYFIVHRLRVPYASLTTILPSDLMTSVLNIPSFYRPQNFPIPMSRNEGTLSWRLKNTAIHILLYFIETWYIDISQYGKYIPEATPPTVEELARNSKIWLIETDDLLDNASPKMPHVFEVGGLSVSPPKPLKMPFIKLAESAKSSLIIVSFGGSIDYLLDDYYDKLLNAMSTFHQYTFIWKIKQTPSGELPRNVHLFDWIPQKDLLGHHNTVLFVTHCGSAGQYEALYSGVPMLGIPIFGDQFSNAVRMTKKGYGLYLDLKTFEAHELVDLITEIITNNSYSENIKKSSKMYKLKVPAAKRAADALEHVLQYGADHLRSPILELNSYQLLMWDILFFVLFIVHVIVIITVFCTRTICKMVSKKGGIGRKMNVKVEKTLKNELINE